MATNGAMITWVTMGTNDVISVMLTYLSIIA